MKRLIIVGAGGFGREILSWLQHSQTTARQWEVIGFLDDDAAAMDRYEYHLPIIGSIKDYQPHQEDHFIMGIASPTQIKLQIVEGLTSKGADFITFVHPSVIMGYNVIIGKGTVICPNCILTCDINIGNFVTININATIGHDVSIGDGCTIQPLSSISGSVKLCKGVEVGSHGCLMPQRQVGNFAKIGAGSLVINNVKPLTTVLGVPAKKL
jgi:sugar O-acyltransferase (sialic acid O-acetyltransferase NeuD family)